MYNVMSAWHNQTALVPVASISQHLPINKALWVEGNMVVLNWASGSTVHILKRAYNIQLKIITLKIFIQTNIEVNNKEMETFELIVNKTDKFKQQINVNVSPAVLKRAKDSRCFWPWISPSFYSHDTCMCGRAAQYVVKLLLLQYPYSKLYIHWQCPTLRITLEKQTGTQTVSKLTCAKVMF